MSQLSLPIARLQRDRLCGQLRITPALEGEDGSLTARWIGTDRIAWQIDPVPPGCHAHEEGRRWFYRSRSSAKPATVGSGGMSGSCATREEALEAALCGLEHVEGRCQRARLRERARERCS